MAYGNFHYFCVCLLLQGIVVLMASILNIFIYPSAMFAEVSTFDCDSLT